MPLPGSRPEAPPWQRVLERGFWRTLLLKGALGWGLTFAALFGAVQHITGRSSDWLSGALDALPLGLVAGAIHGWAVWGIASIQAIKARQRQNEEDE
ncbi:hypothetical protein [Chitinilyticum litopenaei]|uniref:hypothetical protein n=1 Tax=Chitinilyticum litopenaei TaxID=1121276 RepID=UPI0004087989|nr:hypothetical protein [Chitinilyticum litopenaei]